MKAAVAHFYWSHLADAARVLDLGCATGDLGRYKPDGTEVWGLELDRVLVEDATRHETAQVWDLDMPAPLPFPDAHFDAVVAKDILEHLQKPWYTLAEIKRVLKPGGTVLASVICYRDKRIWNDYTHVRGFTMNSLRNMFRDAGFQVIDIWRMGGVPLSSRLNFVHLIPHLLRFQPFDWLWTSSYEIKVRQKNEVEEK